MTYTNNLIWFTLTAKWSTISFHRSGIAHFFKRTPKRIGYPTVIWISYYFCELSIFNELPVFTSELKFVSKIFGRIGFRGYTINDLVEKGEGAITISPSNMKANEMNFESCTYISWFKYEESPEIKIFNGDVLFVKKNLTLQ